MAPKHEKKKKKRGCCPCLSSSVNEAEDCEEYLISLSESPEEDLGMLHSFETILDSTNNTTKEKKKKKKKSKSHKKAKKKTELELKKLQPPVCQRRESDDSYEFWRPDRNDRIKKKSLKKKPKKPKINKCHIDPDQDHHQKNLMQVELYYTPECSHVQIPVTQSFKKTKKKRYLLGGSVMPKMTDDNLTLEHRGMWQHTRSPEGISSIQSEQQVIYELLCLPPVEKNLLEEEVHEQASVCSKNKPWTVAPCKKRVVFDTAVQHFSSDSVGCKSRQGSTRATYREPEDDFCCTEPLLSSSPVLEIKSCDSEDEFNVHCTKKRREYRAESTHGLVEEACNSQDLFLTQKTFLPRSGSSDGSVSSPSAQSDKYTECQKTTGHIKRTRTSEVNLPCLRSSPMGQSYENYCLVSSRKLGPITEKATQTDDFFSSRALATSLGFYKTQRDNKCTEKPVDLSLPSRMRAEIASNHACRCHVNGEGDGVHISPKYVSCHTSNCIPISGDENQTNCLNTFCRLSEDGKYIQTQLNESYFFKLKGESQSPESQAPLMKEKVMHEKKKKPLVNKWDAPKSR